MQASPFEMNGRLHVERGGPKFIETLVEGCEVRAGIFHDTPFEEHSPHAPPLPPSPSMLEEGKCFFSFVRCLVLYIHSFCSLTIHYID